MSEKCDECGSRDVKCVGWSGYKEGGKYIYLYQCFHCKNVWME